MPISDDLFYSILAMDTYNRGYGAGLSDAGDRDDEDGLGETGNIGTATIDVTSAILLDENGKRLDKKAGFYAVAYEVDGQTVISYRGTNQNAPEWWEDSGEGSDFWNGYGVAVGSPLGPQARLAAQFYQSVVASKLPDKSIDQLTESDLRGANISLTGHSMGGGLAGFVAALYGKDAVIFDNMPFELAAKGAHAAASGVSNGEEPFVGNPSYEAVLQDFYLGHAPWETKIDSNLRGFATPGEFLENLRAVGQTTSVNPVGPNSSPENIATGASIFTELHAQALLVVTKYLDDAGTQKDWHSVYSHLVKSIFSNEVAQNINPGKPDSSVSLSKLAYSAINEGERPFGDTGIRALLNDANQLGAVVGSGNPRPRSVQTQNEPNQIRATTFGVYAGAVEVQRWVVFEKALSL